MAAVLVLAAVTLTGCSQNAGPFMALLTNTGTSDDGADLAVEQETAAAKAAVASFPHNAFLLELAVQLADRRK